MRTFRIIEADVLDGLRTLPDGSVRCCVTSPPYWGLRDYGTAEWEGGAIDCDHRRLMGGTGAQNLGKSAAAQSANVERSSVAARGICPKCGARRIDRQLGLEKTPDEYVSRMVGVFREVRRVLADDGTLWLNLGDSYANGPTANIGSNDAGRRTDTFGCGRGGNREETGNPGRQGTRPVESGLKPKDLVGIPWRVAFALQADGWYLRQDIIWSKPNPMPESVRDRCTKAHEYLFLLSKSARYYYDAGAVVETGTGRAAGKSTPDKTGCGKGFEIRAGFQNVADVEWYTRNRRSVWSIATEPFPGAHFAVMPTALVEPCILAGSAEGDTVLDPFAGSGTVGVVALRAGRSFVGCELNPEYAAMARNRIRDDAPLLNQEVAA